MLMATPGALATLSQAEITASIRRHHCGDWGYLCPEDREANELALQEGSRLFSVYYGNAGTTKFYIITEADRSVTTVLLPEEY